MNNKNPWGEADKLFLSSWPHGELRPVKTLGRHNSMIDGIYIQYLDGKGGTDTTTKEFLFDIPDNFYTKLHQAVFSVLEGWTLPDGVRKILEKAYYGENHESRSKKST